MLYIIEYVHIDYYILFIFVINTIICINLKATIFHHLFNINKIRLYITKSTALTITHTLILPRMQYTILF